MQTECSTSQRTAIDERLFLSAEEAADMLGVTPGTVLHQRRIGRLRGVMVGRYLRFRPDDVRAFAAELAGGADDD